MPRAHNRPIGPQEPLSRRIERGVSNVSGKVERGFEKGVEKAEKVTTKAAKKAFHTVKQATTIRKGKGALGKLAGFTRTRPLTAGFLATLLGAGALRLGRKRVRESRIAKLVRGVRRVGSGAPTSRIAGRVRTTVSLVSASHNTGRKHRKKKGKRNVFGH